MSVDKEPHPLITQNESETVSANTLPVVIEANTAIAPPTDLVEAARDFARASHAKTTREA